MTDKIIKDICEKTEEVEDRVIRFVGSSEAVDRDGDLIPIKSWQLDNYKSNPVVLINHQRPLDAVSYAKTKNVWVDNSTNKLMFDIEFAPKEVSEVSDSLYRWYKWAGSGTTSVGFITDRDEVKYVAGEKRKDGAKRILAKNELLEISLVSTPANPEATMTGKSLDDAVEAKVLNQEELNKLNKWFDTLEDSTPDQSTTKEASRIAELEAYVAQLELQIEELKMDADIEKDPYTKIFEKYFTGTQATETDEHTDEHTDEKVLDIETLNKLYNKKDKNND